ncbi:MAG: ORC1-type DNA replication protein [Candidatus Nanoarchaeia archaeon]
MAEKGLSKFFEDYLKRKPLFIDKKYLQPTYVPKEIPHRKKQMEEVASILAPALKKEKPSNLFIYGKTGTGKTVVVKYVTREMEELANKKNVPIKIVYLNCKLQRIADTEYRLIAQIIREMGGEVPTTGLPTKDVYDLFLKILEQQKTLLILILDEIDQLVNKIGDHILYSLTRINPELKHSQVSIIGISNDLRFTNNMDPRVKSSLSEEEVLFEPYNAIQLQDILRKRAKLSIREDAMEEGLIEKCAAYAAREHGDARRAIELLRVAGEIAERNKQDTIMIKHLDMAQEKIDQDRITEAVKTSPKQFKLVLQAILELNQNNGNKIFTGDIYDTYKKYSTKAGVNPLTLRRVSDIIAEMDMMGIINTKVISKGRGGRTREIGIELPETTKEEITKLLKEGLTP